MVFIIETPNLRFAFIETEQSVCSFGVEIEVLLSLPNHGNARATTLGRFGFRMVSQHENIKTKILEQRESDRPAR